MMRPWLTQRTGRETEKKRTKLLNEIWKYYYNFGIITYVYGNQMVSTEMIIRQNDTRMKDDDKIRSMHIRNTELVQFTFELNVHLRIASNEPKRRWQQRNCGEIDKRKSARVRNGKRAAKIKNSQAKRARKKSDSPNKIRIRYSKQKCTLLVFVCIYVGKHDKTLWRRWWCERQHSIRKERRCEKRHQTPSSSRSLSLARSRPCLLLLLFRSICYCWRFGFYRSPFSLAFLFARAFHPLVDCLSSLSVLHCWFNPKLDILLTSGAITSMKT